MSDKERQEDELEALQSIYPQELIVKNKWPFSGCLKISPSILADEFPVKVISKVGDRIEEKLLKVRYLPPIELYFQCPNDYPSISQPNFMLNCMWLPDSQLTQICRKLDALWDSYRTEILFTWSSFLKEDCCAFLELYELRITLDMELVRNTYLESGTSVSSAIFDDNETKRKLNDLINNEYGAKTLNMKPLNERNCDEIAKKKGTQLRFLKKSRTRKKPRDDIYKYETPKDIEKKEKSVMMSGSAKNCDKPVVQEVENQDNSSSKLMKHHQIFKIMSMFGKRRKSKSVDDLDPRIIPKTDEVTQVVRTIEEYNDRILEVEFRTENHSCEVCYEVKSGPDCTRFKLCQHVFCKNCVKDYLTMHILNGNMGALRCLQYECNSSFTDNQIRQYVDDEIYKKYRKFSLKFAVESDPNLLYCPREICQSVARISNLSQDMCHCENCGFYFCMYCKKAYHGIEMCDLKSEERLKVVREYQEANAERKLELEKRFTKQLLMKWVSEVLSQKWLQECSKPCPNCRAVIQKVDGCNKMMCLNCNTPFCWLCNICLSRTQPYKHFIDPQSPCYQKLFPPEEMEEEEFDEGEFEEGEEDEQFFAVVDEMLVNINDPVFAEMLHLYFVD